MKELEHIRAQAREQLARTGLPSGEHESWRKVRLDGFQPDEFHYDAATQLLADVPDGVRSITVTPASNGSANLREFPDTIADGVMRSFSTGQIDPEVAYFPLQNLAYHQHALILYVERTPAAPIRLRHTLESGNALLHRVFIATAPSVEVTVLDEFTDAGPDESQSAHLWNPETHIQAGANSQVRYVSHRNYAAPVYHFHRISSEQARDSYVHVSIIHSGGLAGKGHVVARMLEPGARYRGIGICSATNREFHNMEMLVEHHASHTESSLLYKTVLKDRAHSVFDGNLFITPGVKHVDSLQVNNNILMNRRARAESLPRLVIRAEDVSCEHGATVGELDKDALFFLMARGLTEEQARTLLIEGFLTGVIEEIPLDAGQIEIFLQEMKDKLAL